MSAAASCTVVEACAAYIRVPCNGLRSTDPVLDNYRGEIEGIATHVEDLARPRKAAVGVRWGCYTRFVGLVKWDSHTSTSAAGGGEIAALSLRARFALRASCAHVCVPLVSLALLRLPFCGGGAPSSSQREATQGRVLSRTLILI